MKLRHLALAVTCLLALVAPAPVNAVLWNVQPLGSFGATDTVNALTTTPYKAFTTTPGSSYRAAVDIGCAVGNTSDTWVLLLPKGSTAPANLAAMQADPRSYDLKPGDRLIGGTDTDFNADIYLAQASGTGAVAIVEKSQASSTTLPIRYAASNGATATLQNSILTSVNSLLSWAGSGTLQYDGSNNLKDVIQHSGQSVGLKNPLSVDQSDAAWGYLTVKASASPLTFTLRPWVNDPVNGKHQAIPTGGTEGYSITLNDTSVHTLDSLVAAADATIVRTYMTGARIDNVSGGTLYWNSAGGSTTPAIDSIVSSGVIGNVPGSGSPSLGVGLLSGTNPVGGVYPWDSVSQIGTTSFSITSGTIPSGAGWSVAGYRRLHIDVLSGTPAVYFKGSTDNGSTFYSIPWSNNGGTYVAFYPPVGSGGQTVSAGNSIDIDVTGLTNVQMVSNSTGTCNLWLSHQPPSFNSTPVLNGHTNLNASPNLTAAVKYAVYGAGGGPSIEPEFYGVVSTPVSALSVSGTKAIFCTAISGQQQKLVGLSVNATAATNLTFYDGNSSTVIGYVSLPAGATPMLNLSFLRINASSGNAIYVSADTSTTITGCGYVAGHQ